MSESPNPKFKNVEGLKVSERFPEENIRSTIKYKPRDDDVFVVTYPKCGTTWTSYILSLIFRHGEPFENPWNYFSNSPLIELMGVSLAETMIRPGSIKMHLPFFLTPWSEKAKYIYVTRNPKDCCISYFYHEKSMSHLHTDKPFDQFFEEFLTGEINYGDYFDHLLGWYAHREDPNVLFITFEELKQDIETAILKMASFIDDKKYAEPLRSDPEKLANVVKYSSVQEMKKSINSRMEEMFTKREGSGAPEGMKQFLSKLPQKDSKADNTSNFVRKGIIGDWRNHLSEDQSRRMDEKAAEKLKGTYLASLWEKHMKK